MPTVRLAAVQQAAVQQAAVQQAVTDHGVAGILGAVRSQGVRLELPRLTDRLHSALRPHLAALGMPTASDSREADLSGMTDQARLHLNGTFGFVIHDSEQATPLLLGRVDDRSA